MAPLGGKLLAAAYRPLCPEPPSGLVGEQASFARSLEAGSQGWVMQEAAIRVSRLGLRLQLQHGICGQESANSILANWRLV